METPPKTENGLFVQKRFIRIFEMLTKSCLFIVLLSSTTVVAGDNLAPLFTAYHQFQTALAQDQFKAAQSAAVKLQTEAKNVQVSSLNPQIQAVWGKKSNHLSKSLKQVGTVNDIKGLRASFEHISMAVIALSKVANPEGFQEYRCPMAFNNRGANWLQKGDKTANPYFGSSMLRCGAPVPAKQGAHKHHH